MTRSAFEKPHAKALCNQLGEKPHIFRRFKLLVGDDVNVDASVLEHSRTPGVIGDLLGARMPFPSVIFQCVLGERPVQVANENAVPKQTLLLFPELYHVVHLRLRQAVSAVMEWKAQ